MIPVQGYAGRKVGVLGLGRTGLSAARALAEGGADVIGWDDSETTRDAAAGAGVAVSRLTRELDDMALLVVSPGVPHLYPEPHPLIAAAQEAGVPVDNDIGLFFRSLATGEWDRFASPPRVVAVTGSNGKSTTCALIHHVLREAGKPTQLAGNIGRPILDIDPPGDGEVIVLELSSYQLELARALTPDIGVLTNLTPDHLDRHGGIGGYFAAKRRLFAEGGPDRAVIGIDEKEGRFLAGQLSQGKSDVAVIRVSSGRKLADHGWAVFARKGFLSEYRKGRQVASFDMRPMRGLPGAHNHQNGCAAYAALRCLGIAPRLIEDAFQTFRGLAHRSQFIAEIDGVAFVNDSKATNVDAAAKALGAFANIRWIAGGRGKDGAIEPLLACSGNIRKAYLIGENAEQLARTLTGIEHEICETMEAAVARAAGEADPGDTVLLAPAAASFDQYRDFEARGDDFVAQVARLRPG